MTTAAKLREAFIRCFRPDYGEKPFQHHLDAYACAVWNEAIESAAKEAESIKPYGTINDRIRALKELGHE